MVSGTSGAYMSTSPSGIGLDSILRSRLIDGTVDASSGAMVLPPLEGLTQVSGDEEADFSGRKAVVSEFLIVV
jgi:hypothetical protein